MSTFTRPENALKKAEGMYRDHHQFGVIWRDDVGETLRYVGCNMKGLTVVVN